MILVQNYYEYIYTCIEIFFLGSALVNEDVKVMEYRLLLLCFSDGDHSAHVQDHHGHVLPRLLLPRLHDAADLRLLCEGHNLCAAVYGSARHCVLVLYIVSAYK